MTDLELVRCAFDARERAYAPYSHHKVGAALLGRDGSVVTGCNIENAAYTPTNCAERTAFFKAVSEGICEFDTIAIVGGPDTSEDLSICAPCGVCRQVMMEFCDPETFRILLGKRADGEISFEEHTLKELLPLGFSPAALGKRPQTGKGARQSDCKV